ncbi:YybH family protein [Streptomyces noboritoensis]|uniref:YybH family protein n=1 Tax=Streptomyces noboritoensis TaxID=67337 RepID=A0ABV6TBT7_9ACTN
MNINMDIAHHHDSTVALTSDAVHHPSVFEAAFNSGSAQAVAAVYERNAVFVPRAGEPVTGAELRAAKAEFQSLGLPISVHPRHTYVADDIALLIVDWVIDGEAPDGNHVHIEGTATDVARRGPDGLWRYVIDNPFGTADSPSPGESAADGPTH